MIFLRILKDGNQLFFVNKVRNQGIQIHILRLDNQLHIPRLDNQILDHSTPDTHRKDVDKTTHFLIVRLQARQGMANRTL
jgi:hypothetical protein